jgi:hypothetical protein
VHSLSHLTSCTPTKSNSYLINFLTTLVRDPDLYRLLIFHVPNLISLFHWLGRTEGLVWFRGIVWYFVTWLHFYGEELLTPHKTPKLENHPMSAVRYRLFNISAATFHIWRPFLHSQPEDAPCRGNRYPHITGTYSKHAFLLFAHFDSDFNTVWGTCCSTNGVRIEKL